MPRRIRNDDIRADYQKRYRAGLRNEVILKELAIKYYLSELTVERIVFQRGRYKPKNDDP